MKSVQILDCTLRDGGRIIDCKFDNKVISNMAKDLAGAGVDIIEMGFLRDHKLVNYNGDSTFFTEIKQILPFIPKERKESRFVAFVDFNMYDFAELEPCDGNSITGIRVGFTKKQFDSQRNEIIEALLTVKRQGYLLFVQGVNSLAYRDRELLDLIDMINDVEPYSYGIVDTYGAMYLEDLVHFYSLIDYNLNSEICIDIHSHNNFQSSFAFAQEIIRLADGKRNIILDATLNGMGKCAGNLNTELITDYLTRKKDSDYNIDRILDAIDRYLLPLRSNCSWGYSIPAFMAGIYKAHPNNIIYLTEKYRLNSKDIKYIISGIDENTRQIYDYDNIQRIYRNYNENVINDSAILTELQKKLEDKCVLILVPGNTIKICHEEIMDFILKENPIVISVNFVPVRIECDNFFFANTIHWEKVCDDIDHNKCIVTSNIHEGIENVMMVDYASLISEDSCLYDNSTIMILNLLKKLNVSKIRLAGFDGLKENAENYVDRSFPDANDSISIKRINKEIIKLYNSYKKKVTGKIEVSILTPSIYEE